MQDNHKHLSQTYLSRLYRRKSPELEHHTRPPPTEDLLATTGGVLGQGGFGKILSLGKDSVEKEFTDPAANAEADRYDHIRNLLGCNRAKQRNSCCNHFLFAVRRGKKLLLSPRGIPLDQFFDARVRKIAEGLYPEKWKRCGPPRLCTYLFLMRDLISAVNCLHSVHMAHGDIKSANVIVDCPVGELKPRYTGLLVDLDALQEIDDLGHAKRHVSGTVRTQERQDFEMGGRITSYNAIEDDWYATAVVAVRVWKAWIAVDGSGQDYADLGIGLLEEAVAGRQQGCSNNGGHESCSRVMDFFRVNVTRGLMRHMCDAGPFGRSEPLNPDPRPRQQEPSESLSELVKAYRDWYGFDDKCVNHEDCKHLTLRGPDGRVIGLQAPICCRKKKPLGGRCVDQVNMKGALGDRCEDAGLPRTNTGLPDRVSQKVGRMLPREKEERVKVMRELLKH